MAKVRRVNTSEVQGGYSTSTDIRPNGEIALYDDNNGGFDLVIHNGVLGTSLNRALGKGKLYGFGADSGDGAGYNTIKLIPDVNLVSAGSDQYIIVDPTSPNHVHLRAGGNQNNSTAELFLGAEDNSVQVSDSNNLITINVSPAAWSFSNNGSITFPNATVQSTAWAGGRVVAVPTHSTGTSGDQTGDIAFSSGYLYYCIAPYGQTGHQVVVATLYNGETSINSNQLQLTKTADTLQITTGDIISDSDGGATSVVGSVNHDDNYTYIGTGPGGSIAYNCVFPLTFTSTDYIPGGNIWKRIAWSNDTW